MAIKQVVISDLTGNEIPDDKHTRLVISGHPDTSGDVELDVSSDEVANLESVSIELINLTIYEPNARPRQVVLDRGSFGSAFKGTDVETSLKNARRTTTSTSTRQQPTKRRASSGSGASAKGDRVDYGTLEHAGELHRGRVTEVEAKLVRENLDEINKRLELEGRPTIDPKDPKHKKRYRF